jgi:hypothetical protein
MPAQLMTYADNSLFNVRHISPMMIEDSIYNSISQMVQIALSENQESSH